MVKKLFLLIFLPLLTSCLDEPDCVREASNIIKIGFKDITSGQPLNVEFNKVTVSGTDSIFYTMITSSALMIPLNILENSSTIIFDTGTRVDTLTLRYKTTTRLISPECGPETFITGITAEDHTLDSLRAINANLLPDIPVNYEIFY